MTAEASNVGATETPTKTTFLVVGGRPLLVIDLGGPRPPVGDLAAPLVPFHERGMSLLPGLFEVPIPADSTLVFHRTSDGWELRDGIVHRLLVVPDTDAPIPWAEAVTAIDGVLLLVGLALELEAAVEIDAAVVRLSDAARDGRLLGTLVELN